MRFSSHLVLLSLSLLSSASPTKASDADSQDERYPRPNDAFQDLLDVLPEESLHAALNSLAHYQTGVFESDRHGVERVHQEDPPLATKLIVAAVQDLKKRQQPGNGTSPVAVPPSSQTPSPNEPASSNVIPVPVPVTSVNSRGQTIVSTGTRPAVVLTATNAAGSTFLTTSPIQVTPTPTLGQVISTTDAAGSVFLTTYTPPGGIASSIVLITTTGSDGRQSIVTSYVAAGATGTVRPSQGSSSNPGLQNDATRVRGGVAGMVMGGLLLGAAALLA